MNVRGKLDRLLHDTRELTAGAAAESARAALWSQITDRLAGLFPDDDDDPPTRRFIAALGDDSLNTVNPPGFHEPTPVQVWFHDLLHGQARLPPEMTAAAFAPLLAVLLDPPCPLGSLSQVCRACGLGRPAAAPATYQQLCDGRVGKDPFTACPHCGGGEWQWSSRSGAEQQPWHDLPGSMPRGFFGEGEK